METVWIKMVEGAGPYMGTAILMAMIQGLVILKSTDKVFRTRALYLTVGVQVVALAGGLIVNFLKDI